MRVAVGFVWVLCLLLNAHECLGAAKFQTVLTLPAAEGSVLGNIAMWNGKGYGVGGDSVDEVTVPTAGDPSWHVNSIFHFSSVSNAGYVALGGLIISDGTIYGATTGGGTSECSSNLQPAPGCGLVYRLTAPATSGGTWTYTALKLFHPDAAGFNPVGPLVFRGGSLYGTTYGGGANGGGVVFKLTPPKTGGGEWVETVLYAFSAEFTAYNPMGGLTFGPVGEIYGTVASGGACAYGAIFKLTPPAKTGAAWQYTEIHQFGEAGGNCDTALGAAPTTAVHVAGNTLIGVTSGFSLAETPHACGVVYSQSIADPSTYRVLYAFQQPSCSPTADVLVDPSGTIYGTTNTPVDAEDGFGTVFKLTPGAGGAYAFSTLHTFAGTESTHPWSSLLRKTDGTLYGTTSGAYPRDPLSGKDFGSVFRITQ